MTTYTLTLNWQQLASLSRRLTRGLPHKAANNNELSQLVFMAPQSMGRRITSPDMASLTPIATLENAKHEGGLWHGFSAEQATSFTWAPFRHKDDCSIVATKQADGSWHVVYTPPKDTKGGYYTALALVTPTLDPRHYLMLKLRAAARGRNNPKAKVRTWMASLGEAVHNSSNDPFTTIPKQAAKRVRGMEMDALRIAVKPEVEALAA